jgi:hypothetical protein
MEKSVMGFRLMGFVVDVLLRKLFGGKMEKLTEGWREMKWALGE